MTRRSVTRLKKLQIERRLASERYDRGNPEGLVRWKDLEVYVQDQLTGLEQHLDRKHGPGSTLRWVFWHLGQALLAIWGLVVFLLWEWPRGTWRNWRVSREHRATRG